VDPVPDSLLLRKSGSARNRTRDLWVCSQEVYSLDHRGGHIERYAILIKALGHFVQFIPKVDLQSTLSLQLRKVCSEQSRAEQSRAVLHSRVAYLNTHTNCSDGSTVQTYCVRHVGSSGCPTYHAGPSVVVTLVDEADTARVEVTAAFPCVHAVTHEAGQIVRLLCGLWRLASFLIQHGRCKNMPSTSSYKHSDNNTLISKGRR
jgi:hypothetical protein